MKKIIYWFLFLFVIFLLNVAWYFFSENYRFLLKKIKHWDNYVMQDDETLKDLNFSDEEIQKTNNWTWTCDCSKSQCILEDSSSWVFNKVSTWTTQLQDLENIQKSNTTNALSWEVLSDELTYSWIINQVKEKFSWYDFKYKPYWDDYMMFGFTDEYPNKYLTYNAWKFEIYFFVDDNFDKVYDFFELLSKDLNFEVKKTNNFWNRSFYINTTDAKFIKVIVKSWDKLFWLNIKKQYYNEVKDILKNF